MNRTGTHEYLDALLKRSVSVCISTVNVGNLYHKIVGSLLVFSPQVIYFLAFTSSL